MDTKMDMVQKLVYLMNKHNIKNILTLANEANLPYTTLTSIFNRDTSDIRLSTAKKLCDFFGISLDQLLNDDIFIPELKNDLHIAAATDYVDTSGLDDRTKYIINKIVNDFKNENN